MSKNKTKKEQEDKKVFSINQTGLYAVSITARCQHGADLRVEIDNQVFRELPAYKYKQVYNVPSAWNGVKLLGKSQTNVFVINLEEGEHVIKYYYKGEVVIEDFSWLIIDNPEKIVVGQIILAKNLNRQPWLNIILVNQPLEYIEAKVGVAWHKWDGDDVKLIVDGQVYSNNRSTWLWRGKKEQEEDIFVQRQVITTNLAKDIHYVQFVADQSPEIKNLVLSLKNPKETKQFIGDFQCRSVEVLPSGEKKWALGIYKYGVEGRTFDVSNDKYKLYFNGEILPLGETLKDNFFKEFFGVEINLASAREEENDWFYFGIDSTFGWINFLTTFGVADWRRSDLWSIYEKQDE